MPCDDPYNFHSGCAPYEPTGQGAAGNDTCFVIDNRPFMDTCLPVEGHEGFSYPIVFYLDRVLGDIDLLQSVDLLAEKCSVTVCYYLGPTGPAEIQFFPPSVPFDINGKFNGTLEATKEELQQINPPPNFRLFQGRWGLHTFSVEVHDLNWSPVDTTSTGSLRLPGDPSGAVRPARNVLTVYTGLDAPIIIDWIRIKIRAADPILLVHGWNGSPGTWDEWDEFIPENLGLPFHDRMDLAESRSRLDNIVNVREALDDMAAAYGTSRVTMVGHSKGGIVARLFASSHSERVPHVVTLSSAHLGTPLVNKKVSEQRISIYRKGLFTVSQVGLWLMDALGPGYQELSDTYLTPERAHREFSPDVRLIAVGGIWDGSFDGTPGANEFIMKETGKFLSEQGGMNEANDGVVGIGSALGLPYGDREPMERPGTPDYNHIRLVRQEDVHEDILIGRYAFGGPLARTGATRQTDTLVPAIAELEAKAGLLIGSSVASESTFAGDAGRVTCIIQVPDTTTQVAVQFPGLGWVDSAVAATDTSLTFGRSTFLGTDAVLVSAQAPAPGLIRYSVQSPLAAAGDTATFGAHALVHDAEGWTRLSLSEPAVVQGDTVVVSMLSRDGTGCTACADTVLAVSRAWESTSVSLRDDGVSPDDVANDGVSHGRLILTSQPGLHSLVGMRTCRDSTGALCRLTTSASSCNVVQGASATLGDVQVVEGRFELYDWLIGVLPIEMAEPGHVLLFGTLMKDTVVVARASIDTTLGSGSQVVQLRFPGRAIYDAGLDGPFVIAAEGEMERGDQGVDVLFNSVTTPAYEYTDFTHDLVRVAGLLTWDGKDVTSDGKFDSLVVRVPIASDVAGEFLTTAVLRDRWGNGLGSIASGTTIAVGDTGVQLVWPGAPIGALGVSDTLFVTDFGLATDDVVGGLLTYQRDYLGSLVGVASSGFDGGMSNASRTWAVNASVTLCPSGDADSLAVGIRMPVAFGASPLVEDHEIYAIRTGTTGGPVTLWRGEGPGSTAGDTLWVTSHVNADTTAVLGWARGSGCGATTWQCYVDGAPVGNPVTVNARSLDPDGLALGAVDRFDMTTVTNWLGSGCGPCLACGDLDASGSLTAADTALVRTHQGHHIPRRLNAPQSLEAFAPGATTTVVWQRGYGDSARVTIRAHREGSGDSVTVVADDPDDGTTSWTVPTAIAGSTYRLQVIHTAGHYKIDNRDIGWDKGDTTVTIRPRPVADLAATSGRTTWAIGWSEPDQGAEADAYEVRCMVNTPITENNFASGVGLQYLSAPGPEFTGHCKDSSSTGSCKTFYFAIRTMDNGVWSLISNVASVSTKCSGSQAVMCLDEGLLAGGGGEEGLRSGDIRLAGSGRGQAQGNLSANSLLPGGMLGTVSDYFVLPGEPSTRSGAYELILQQTGNRRVQLERVAAGYVDHAEGTVAIASTSGVVIGSLDDALQLQGARLDGSAIAGVHAFHEASPGEEILVTMGTGEGMALVVDARSPIESANADSVGILVQRHTPQGWTTEAIVHPRREFSSLAVPTGESQQMRLVFLRPYEVRSIRRLTGTMPGKLQPLALQEMTHSRTGSTSDSLSLVPGDVLRLRIGLPEPREGMRAYWLSLRGLYLADRSEDTSGGLELSSATPPVYYLGGARPNPSRGSVTIAYSLARSVMADLRVYDVAGREVRTLGTGEQQPGNHEIVWDGRDKLGRKVAAGVYFYRLRTPEWRSERKLIVLQK